MWIRQDRTKLYNIATDTNVFISSGKKFILVNNTILIEDVDDIQNVFDNLCRSLMNNLPYFDAHWTHVQIEEYHKKLINP